MKKLKFISSAGIMLIALIISSCEILQQGIEPLNPEEKTYSLKNFDKLAMGNAFHITVKQGVDFKISVKGDSRDIEDLIVKVSTGELKMYYSKWRVRRYRMEVAIEIPTLKKIDLSGATTSFVEGFEDLDELEIDLSGASRATFVTKARFYEIDLSGASELELEGNAKELDADISGASKLNAFNTQLEKASIEISGASAGRVNVSEKLNVRASGASKVRYRGNPKVSSNLSGSSKVEKD